MHSSLWNGVIGMTVCFVGMPSYTFAVKAEKLLRSKGYQCRVVRKEKTASESCGFMLKVNGHCREAAEILDRYAVPYKSLTDDGGA